MIEGSEEVAKDGQYPPRGLTTSQTWGETDKHPAVPVDGVGESFASRLLSWWADNGNDYKFRRTRDPYRILISEIMLQKTRARQVDAVYDEFFERYPDPQSLAAAPDEEVEAVVAPLGLKSRVATMKRAAELLASKGDAIGYADLLAIDGVGDYVAPSKGQVTVCGPSKS
ncbi:MAG: A/G-specific DNA-adenine glycosylase [Methanothrix harundinacea]|uniref:A/G-specific DNA-adenine glycosylase n=1 Tax=Methanothrix harundinacea TaxID=301375 RepID=A0A117LEX0_9EURY|nr:MAG: A/G-specific DNA-adenine glycosylase [Methanothrix harundinacea]